MIWLTPPTIRSAPISGQDVFGTISVSKR